MNAPVRHFSSATELLAYYGEREGSRRPEPTQVKPTPKKVAKKNAVVLTPAMVKRFHDMETTILRLTREVELLSRTAPLTQEEVEAAKTPNLRTIAQAVSEVFEVSLIDLHSDRRPVHLTMARQALYLLCREMTLRSFPDIGRFNGGRDHTTILHGVRACRKRMEADALYRAKIEAVRAKIVRVFQ